MEKNPLKVIREDADLTLDMLAERAECSRQLIIRAEQGVYHDPPPVLMDYLMDLTEDDILQVSEAYKAWQNVKRVESYGKLVESVPMIFRVQDDDGNPIHPFVWWRELTGVNRIQVSKYFCVHPALVFKYESQPWLCATTPNDLLAALKISGYSLATLRALEAAYAVYKRKLRDA